jgi:hypothetical protein
MKFVRSILAFLREPLLVPVVTGCIVSVVLILAVQMISTVAYAPHAEKPMAERMEAMAKMEQDPTAMKAWLETLPVGAMLLVLASWQLGAFGGGFASALLAGRAPSIHGGIIGGLVLAATIYNFFNMKKLYDFSHPDWMIVAGLLLPLPMSLLGGKLVSMLIPPPPTPPAVSYP